MKPTGAPLPKMTQKQQLSTQSQQSVGALPMTKSLLEISERID